LSLQVLKTRHYVFGYYHFKDKHSTCHQMTQIYFTVVTLPTRRRPRQKQQFLMATFLIGYNNTLVYALMKAFIHTIWVYLQYQQHSRRVRPTQQRSRSQTAMLTGSWTNTTHLVSSHRENKTLLNLNVGGFSFSLFRLQ